MKKTTSRRFIARFKLYELDSKNAEGLVKLASSLTFERDSEMIVKTDTYFEWKRKGAFGGNYPLKLNRDQVDYKMSK
jgi:hypothetical protein